MCSGMDDNTAIMIVHKWLRNFKGYKPTLILSELEQKNDEKRDGGKKMETTMKMSRHLASDCQTGNGKTYTSLA